MKNIATSNSNLWVDLPVTIQCPVELQVSLNNSWVPTLYSLFAVVFPEFSFPDRFNKFFSGMCSYRFFLILPNCIC